MIKKLTRREKRTVGKFKAGDVIRVVSGSSLKWVKRVPLVVVGYKFEMAPSVLDLDGNDPTNSDLDGNDPTNSGDTFGGSWINHVRD